jgi:hypothetical protein
MATPTVIRPTVDPAEGTLNKLVLRWFRAFDFQSIQLAPLTIFVGPNNSGKSSILSALRLLQQTLQSIDPKVPLALGEFGTFRDIAYGNQIGKALGITVGSRHKEQDTSFEASFGYRAQRREIVQMKFALFPNGVDPLFVTEYSRATGKQTVRKLGGLKRAELQQLNPRFSHFVPKLGHFQAALENHKEKSAAATLAAMKSAEHALFADIRKLQNLQYLGPNRDAPGRVFPFSGERPSILGSTGSGATDVLVADYFHRGTGKRKLTQAVESWLIKAGIAAALEVDSISDRHYEMRLRHPITGELQNYADVGYGISQILPVIVGGYNLQTGALLLIEQPEIHLHPSAQSELGDFFLDLYRRGVQCLVETHSEHLIMRLQRHVAEGLIPAEHVAVNYVYAAEDRKVVARLRLNKDGIFIDDWPLGFFEERLNEALEIARAPLRRDSNLV